MAVVLEEEAWGGAHASLRARVDEDILVAVAVEVVPRRAVKVARPFQHKALTRAVALDPCGDARHVDQPHATEGGHTSNTPLIHVDGRLLPSHVLLPQSRVVEAHQNIGSVVAVKIAERDAEARALRRQSRGFDDVGETCAARRAARRPPVRSTVPRRRDAPREVGGDCLRRRTQLGSPGGRLRTKRAPRGVPMRRRLAPCGMRAREGGLHHLRVHRAARHADQLVQLPKELHRPCQSVLLPIEAPCWPLLRVVVARVEEDAQEEGVAREPPPANRGAQQRHGVRRHQQPRRCLAARRGKLYEQHVLCAVRQRLAVAAVELVPSGALHGRQPRQRAAQHHHHGHVAVPRGEPARGEEPVWVLDDQALLGGRHVVLLTALLEAQLKQVVDPPPHRELLLLVAVEHQVLARDGR